MGATDLAELKARAAWQRRRDELARVGIFTAAELDAHATEDGRATVIVKLAAFDYRMTKLRRKGSWAYCQARHCNVRHLLMAVTTP